MGGRLYVMDRIQGTVAAGAVAASERLRELSKILGIVFRAVVPLQPQPSP
jgi:hypothetical protein